MDRPSADLHRLAVGGLFLLGVLVHGTVALSFDGPPHWDSAYAWEVARNVAAGEGAVTRALWALAWLPPQVEHPADLHWMPLPSRILVPAMWLDASWRSALVVPVLVAGLWGPLGWAWAGRVGLRGGRGGGLRWVVGVLAATGLGALPLLGIPDSAGLFGALGAAALLAASERRLAVCMGLCLLAALTRGDGFWVGLACAVAWTDLRAVGPVLAGVGATAAWLARSWSVAGEGLWALRARVSSAGATGDLLLLEGPEAPGLIERVLDALTGLPWYGLLFLLEGGLLPVMFAGVALFLRRGDRGLWPVAVLPVLVMVGDPLLAPGVAGQGTTWRTLAAVLPPVAALGVLGATQVLRGLPAWLLPGVVAVFGAGLAILAGSRLLAPFPTPDDCAALADAEVPPGAVVLVTEPLQVTARCHHPAVQIPPVDAESGLIQLAERYDIHWAVTAPDDHKVEPWRTSAFELSGWGRVSERVWHRAEPATPAAD